MQKTLLLALSLLATTLLAPAPVAAAEDDCGTMCIDECTVAVIGNSAHAGCTIAHEPRYVNSKCTSNCDWVVLRCQEGAYAQDPGCNSTNHCEQVLVGPDIDQGPCVQTTGPCHVGWYNTYGQDRCYIDSRVQTSTGTCYVRIWEHDWQRRDVCTDVKGECKLYLQGQGVDNSRQCLHP